MVGSSRILRRHFACLPFQISHFDRLGELAGRILPGGQTVVGQPPRMDDAGHIHVDDAQFAALAEAVTAKLDDPDYLDWLESSHRNHLDALENALADPSLDLGEAIADLAPYGLFTKVVPPRLRQVILAGLDRVSPGLSGDERERLLEPAAPGAVVLALALPQAALDLLEAGCGLGRAGHPDRLPDAARQRLEDWSRRLAGFGPHAWEAPGYECPVTLLAALEGRFAGLDAARLMQLINRQKSRHGERLAARDALDRQRLTGHGLLARQIMALRYWSAYVDDQATRLRRAFLLGWLPRLRQWLPGGPPEDLLFLTRQEVMAGPPPGWQDRVPARRQAYHRHGASPEYPGLAEDRLAQLLGGNLSPPIRPVPQRPRREAASLSGSLSGMTAASRASVQGHARVLGADGNLTSVPAGAILVTALVTPDMAPLFWNIAGVVVEEGGLLQHATALAREFGLPCVVGCAGATGLIRDGDPVWLDGEAGRVRYGFAKEEHGHPA